MEDEKYNASEMQNAPANERPDERPDARAEKPRIKGMLIAMAACFAASAALLVAGALTYSELMSLAVPPLTAGAVLLICAVVSALERARRQLVVPAVALALDLACVPLALLGGASMFVFGALALLFFLAAISAPVAAVILAIYALCSCAKGCKAGIILSVTAIALPVIAILVAVIGFSTGAFVIVLM